MKIPAFAAHYRKSDETWQRLEDHLDGVALLAKQFASKLGLASHGEILGLLHDFGKYSQVFQAYLKSAVGLLERDQDADWVDADSLRGKIDHSTAGAQFIWNELLARATPTSNEALVAQVLALCIASHHSGLINCIGADGNTFGDDTFGKRVRKASDLTHLDEVVRNAALKVTSRAQVLLAEPSLRNDFSTALQRIVCSELAERSCDPRSDLVVHTLFGLLVRALFSCLIDADRIDSADFEGGQHRRKLRSDERPNWTLLAARLEHHLSHFSKSTPIDEIREEVSTHCLEAAARSPGRIYTLTVPTGGGKTLGALRFSLHHAAKHRLDRILFVIPFTSIIDQNATVVRSILEPAESDRSSIVLEHHSNVTPEHQGWREKVLSENWNAPVVFTTFVQLLDTLFGSGTRGARRMHQIANSVIVFDEIQSLPLQCVHLFNSAMNFLAEQCGSTIVLSTATQPLLHTVSASKGALRLCQAHELAPVRTLFDRLRRVEIRDSRKAGGWSDQELAGFARQSINEARSLLIVVNTKKSARQLYRLLSAECEATVLHLSTNMCAAHRKSALATIRELLDENRPIVCISTQLIEAGVDIDFGCVIRYLAGLDSIAQAAGRCNRHGHRSSGVLHIVNPSDESLASLPDLLIGKALTERVLDEFTANPEAFPTGLIGPEAMNRYYDYYFFARTDKMDYPVSKAAIGHDDTLLNLLSINHQAVVEYGRRNGSMPPTFFRQAFMTAAEAFKAIDAPTEGVIVPYSQRGKDLVAALYGSFDISREIELLKESQQYSVNVFPATFEALMRAGALHQVRSDLRIHTLDARYYDERLGLTTEASRSMETINV